jgi:UDP-N-acetylglucosamine 2-epimerase
MEAGLRIDDKWQPFPEEVKVTGLLVDTQVVPTTMTKE